MSKKTLLALFSLFCVTQFATNAEADPKFIRVQKIRARHFTQNIVELQSSQDGLFDQKINHANPLDRRTFKQRYFVNSEFAENNNSPVLYVICGEGTCDASAFNGAPVDWARKFKAHLVALEHRYYGKSQPFEKLTTANLRYLKTPFALIDLARFQKFAVSKLGLKGKWITIGGSYSGSLSAYYRQKFPKNVVGALASSGPVEARANFKEYDETVTEAVGPECADAMRKAVREIEDALGSPEKLAHIKNLFNSTEIKDNLDFLYVVADMGAFAAQYGYQKQFCEELTSDKPLEGYARAGTKLFAMFGMSPVDDTPQGAMSLDPKDYLKWAARQWTYQVCTEYGYYQVASPDRARSTRSALLDLKYNDKMCERVFGIKKPVRTSRINKTFYLPLLNERKASHVFFTNGSLDPWSRLSITKARGNDVNGNTPSFTIAGASHCEDLTGADSPEIEKAHLIFEKLASSWLQPSKD